MSAFEITWWGSRFVDDDDGARLVDACNALADDSAHPDTSIKACSYDIDHEGNHSWQNPPPACGLLFGD